MNSKQTFEKNLSVAIKQGESFKEAFEIVKSLGRLTSEKMQKISDDNKRNIDSFILRFGKLQDILGSKLFRGVILLSLEDAETMLDVLNKIEKYGIIEKTEIWDKLREARNLIVHEYDIDSEKVANNLNNIVSVSPELIKVLENIIIYAKDKFKINVRI